ncbi:MAG: hypothetical protein KF729_32100 [Sandaracinaceae bacterium]|nr:hypothetical protein [Sandaracinaceae bacterium]
MRASLLALVVLLSPAPGAAQAVDLTRPDPVASALTDVRLSLEVERREAGVVLAFEGLLSLVAGALLAGFGNADPFWIGVGVGTAGWGAVNAALAVALLDLGGDRERAVERARGRLRYDDVARARDAAIRQQSDAATLFAFNTGLDVFYLATGALLFVLADQLAGRDEPELLRGYAVAQMGQGAFLLVFDLIEWIASNDRAGRLERAAP